MSIRKRDVHFSDWTKVRHALVCNNVQGITETSSFDEVRAFLINSESGSNPFYYYVCYIKETNEIYTHGTFYNCTGYNDSDIRDLIQNVEDSFVEQITALQNEVEENEKVTTMALYDLNDRKANKDDLQNINLDKYVDWDSLYSETNSLYSSLQSSINSNYTTLNNNKADKSALDTLSAEVEENEEVTAAALTELHENKADKSEIPDFSTLATKDDINLKQDVLSDSDFATINGTSVFGGDNAIVIEEPDHYASGTATVDGSGFVTSVTTNEAGHVTNVSARAITDNDITSISASKITGTINIENLPAGALERMFVVEDETAAMSATVEEGDVVQVTGNGNKMYFCVRSGATTFSEKFMEFTAGTATSVAWSGVTGKPEGIDGWGDRISTVEADYFSRTGGTITGEVTVSCAANSPLKINSNATDSGIYFNISDASKTWVGYEASRGSVMYHSDGSHRLGINNDGVAFYDSNTLLHSGNYNTYSPSLTGAGASGSWGIDITGTASSANLLKATRGTSLVANTWNNEEGLSVGGWNTEGGWNSQYGTTLNISGFNTWRHRLAFNTNGDIEHWKGINTTTMSKVGNIAYTYSNVASSNRLTEEVVTDLNNATPCRIFTMTSGYGSTDGNKPTTGWVTGLTLQFNQDGAYRRQLAYSDDFFVRDENNGSWGDWRKILTSTNFSDYALPITGGTVSGNLLVTGAIACRDNFRTNDNYYGFSVKSQGSEDNWYGVKTYMQFDEDTTMGVCRIGTSWLHKGLSIGFSTGNPYNYNIPSDYSYTDVVVIRRDGNVSIGGTTADEKLHVHGKMVVSGNIKIPGSNDARYSLYSDGGIRFYAPSSGGWSNTWNLFSNDGGTANGTLCGAFGEGSSLKYIFFGGTWDSPKTVQWPDGTFSIGRGLTKDSGKLNIGGTVRATGKMYAPDFVTTSDNRLKDFVSDIDLDFEALKLIPKKYYYWKDKSMGEDLQIGTSAQELAKIYPTCVSYDEVSDRYSVNYQKLSIVALAAIDKLHERVSELESKLND